MELKSTLVEKMSKKNEPYVAIEIEFPNGYKKLVFLTLPEKYMLDGLLDR